MTLTLWLLLGITLVELICWLSPFWGARNVWAVSLSLGLGLLSLLLIIVHPAVWTALLSVVSAYRILNLLRLVYGNTPADYIFSLARRSSWLLVILQVFTVVAAYAADGLSLSIEAELYFLAGLQLLAALILLSSTLRHLLTTVTPRIETFTPDRDLPALTVAIPARNETETLEACLKCLVESSYPKLEILVLDDCSQAKRTPEIIRSFAHAGVRFLSGQPVPEHWLAKNYAYHQLSEAASGEFILFCGVDARFQPNSLRMLVQVLLQKKKSMLSVMPTNQPPSFTDFGSLMVQPSRYAWELALPRRLFQRPPVLSSCWLVTSQLLDAAGGLKAVSRSSSPESYFARAAANQQDGYSFIVSDTSIGLDSFKAAADQQATAIRTRYPQLHRRPELAASTSLAELAVLAMPLPAAIGCLLAGVWQLGVAFGLTAALMTIFYSRVVSLTYRKFIFRSLWLLPFAALYDIGLLHYSIWRYEFREVIWKGRNVCIPVMRTFPKLPSL